MRRTVVTERLQDVIRRRGADPLRRVRRAALYDEHDGFFTRGGGAGRAGRDFVTSPEVGPLFGALVARALDSWWERAGRSPTRSSSSRRAPGSGRLAADVLRADAGVRARAALRAGGALAGAARRRSASSSRSSRPRTRSGPPRPARPRGAARRRWPGPGPIVTSLDELPAAPVDGVVLANELLDNLPFRIVERAAGEWQEVRVGLDGNDRFIEVLVPAPAELQPTADRVSPPDPAPGTRLPVPTGVSVWFERVRDLLRRGYLLVIDYAADSAELAERGQDGWLRTYRGHERGSAPLEAAGAQDITYDVPVDFLVETAGRTGFTLLDHTTQADWLRGLGVDELAAAAAGEWRERAPVGDLAAVAARSRVHEADALTDPAGLGAHHVFVFGRSGPG